jgi:nucleoside-diphosphate-sugar epimerase
MTQSALVTGATGFVGSQLARRLVSLGQDVHIVVRPESSLRILGDIASRVRVHRHDGTIEGMVSAVEAARPQVVYHLASHIVPLHARDDVQALIVSNVLFGTQLLEAMTAHGVRCFVNTGTSWQHFYNEPYRPVSLYAATKQAFEDILRFYTDATPMRAISLHLFDTYGTGDPRPKLLHLLAKTATTGDSLALSPGEQQLDLVHVDDVVNAFVLAGERLVGGQGESMEVYAVSAGTTISLRGLVDVFDRVTGRPLRIQWGGRPYRFREVMEPWSAGLPVPGWRPTVTIEDGIRRLVEGR